MRFFSFLFVLLFFSVVAVYAQRAYDVAAFVWPAYQPESRFQEIGVFPDGVGEWEAIYNAQPKYEGHNLPNIPLWGYSNEADAGVMEKKISEALKYGVNVFIYDWYWYDDRPFLENGLNEGFLKAKNCEDMRFYLMWANHDHNSYLDPSNPDKSKVYWEGEVDRRVFERMVSHIIEDYFKRPNYYKIDGMPVFAIYELSTFINGLGGMDEAKDALEYFRREVRSAGFPGLHLQGILWGAFPESIPNTPGDKSPTKNETALQLGLNSLTNYQWCHYVPMDKRQDYRVWGDKGVSEWQVFDSQFDIPFFPQVSVGWDPNPRFPVGEQNHVFNASPELFEGYLRMAKEYAACHPAQPPLVVINAWNEWAEGSYLEPDVRNGYRYLEAVQRVFGGRE